MSFNTTTKFTYPFINFYEQAYNEILVAVCIAKGSMLKTCKQIITIYCSV